jgi:hypothetical protein
VEVIGVPKLSIVKQLYNSKISCEMNGHCTIDDKDLAKNRNVKVRIQMLKRLLRQWSNVEKKIRS